ncbi:GNAT family N-acetyltransferase [Micromonospora sp. NBC_01699]|uniref:GNAT family N-acetyltransferase n=1 Tax=Micromonospora sp. NBC_01699 TaxID=2975984 RepID=UPI002E33B0CD|nr:GNAT family N-acetyltransferase [Micromonospora sp. NBC_01699]
MSISYKRLTGSSSAPWVARLVDLYAVVYAEAPYEEGPEEVEGFRVKLPEDMFRPGFELVIATDDDALLGFAYGWTMPAGTWWSKADREPPPVLKAADKLAIMEWIVQPDRRGQGIGAQLIRWLIDGRSEPWATLASDSRSAARAIYERAGWSGVGKAVLSWGPTMDLLVLPLSSIERKSIAHR